MSIAASDQATSKLRLGLCCQFVKEPIRFRATTVKSLLRLDVDQRRRKLSQLCLANAEALHSALKFCLQEGIGSFRVPSWILPVKTHPQLGYDIGDLPDSERIVAAIQKCGRYVDEHSLRTTFHPDQFVVLNSPRPDVVANAVADLEYHAQVAAWIGADVINIHAGGAYGDKSGALARLALNLDRLSDAARSRLTLENDDTTYSPSDLLPLCRTTGLPLVYDVHHHRCLKDELSVEEASTAALRTWNREPVFHISSSSAGRGIPPTKRHHDYIDPCDFPSNWRQLAITVDVEARAKELAIFRLREDLSKDGPSRSA